MTKDSNKLKTLLWAGLMVALITLVPTRFVSANAYTGDDWVFPLLGIVFATVLAFNLLTESLYYIIPFRKIVPLKKLLSVILIANALSAILMFFMAVFINLHDNENLKILIIEIVVSILEFLIFFSYFEYLGKKGVIKERIGPVYLALLVITANLCSFLIGRILISTYIFSPVF